MVRSAATDRAQAQAAAKAGARAQTCLLYTSDAADDLPCVDLGGRRIIKKKNSTNHSRSHAMRQRPLRPR